MNLTADRLRRARLDLGEFAWLLPATLVALILAGSVASLLAGYPAANVIGADGMAGTSLMAP
jgi:hypothetical protein